MPRVSSQQYTFNGGEYSPLLKGRQDLEKYKSGLDTCLNILPLVQGPATRRPGSAFLSSTKLGGTAQSRLIPFQFNVTQAYALEFGDEYIRIYTESGLLTEATKNISAITKANPGVVTINAHGYSNGDRLLLKDIGGMTQLEGREIIVAGAAANTFQLTDTYGNNINTTNYDTFTSGGTVAKIYQVATTYQESELSDIHYTQSADVLYLTHASHAPAKLVRSGALSWSLSDLDPLDGPYLPLNATSTTLELSGTTGSVTVTASAGLFASTDVGRLIRWLDPANDWTWLEITAYTDSTHVTATIRGQDASAGTATINWRLGLYSATTGYPRTCTFHESRLVFGGAAGAPSRIDGSKSSDFENFAPSDKDGLVADDNAISYTLSSGRVNLVQWLQSQVRGLAVGTSGSEWVVRPSTNGEALTPTNVNATESSAYGSEHFAPVRVGDVALYMQRGNRKLREFTYVFESDGFKSPDMTLLADHITLGGIVDLTLQNQPQQIIWAPRTDGTLLALLYSRENNVVAWSRHVLGGYSDSNDTQAMVESVCAIPSLDSTLGDNVFLIVKRYINGRTERYVELLTKIWEQGDDQEDAFHFDSGLTFVAGGAGTDEINGLWHLEGETLGVWADGTVHPDVTISNGKATLDSEYNVITVGEKYDSEGVLLPPDAGSAEGSAQGKTKRIDSIAFILMDTLGLKYGPAGSTDDELTEIIFRQWGQAYNSATPMYTGVVKDRFEGDYDKLAQPMFKISNGEPCTILSVILRMVTQDGG